MPATDDEAAFGDVADSTTVWLPLIEAVSVGGVGLFLVAGNGGETFLFFLGLGGRAARSGKSESEFESLLESDSDSEDDEKIVFRDREDGGGRDNLAMVLWSLSCCLTVAGLTGFYGWI